MDLDELSGKIREFVRQRDWEKFHSPKNLVIGLSVEAVELLEIFTWLTEEESNFLSETKLQKVKEEVGDILIYLLNLCDHLNLDPTKCADEKLEKNKIKYPEGKVRGKASKYDELE